MSCGAAPRGRPDPSPHKAEKTPMKSLLPALIVFLACFALGSLAALAPLDPRPPRASSTHPKAAPEIYWGEGSEADLSKTASAEVR